MHIIGSNNEIIKLNEVEDNCYYYLYIKTDDENGKYVSNEAVTLALSSNNKDNHWFMFFYGDDDFEWADFGENSGGTQEPSEEKPNLANGTFPKTGLNLIIFSSIVVLAISGIVAYKKYKKYNF